MRWDSGRRWLLLVSMLAEPLLLVTAGCATDCDVACGKLEFCGQLPDISRDTCIERCKDRKDRNGDATRLCADCLHGSSCNTVRKGGCVDDCRPVVASEADGGGVGGAAGADGQGGEGGSAGEGAGGAKP